MSNKQNVKTSKSIEESFEHDTRDLIDNCEKITGQKREIAEGALYGESKARMTKQEFKKKIEEFLKRRVK